MSAPETITYLRTGRTLRASGKVVVRYSNGSVKIKPVRDDWRHVVVTKAEIDAGTMRPPPVARKKSEGVKPKRETKPKPVHVPRWKQLVDESRQIQNDHSASYYPQVKMSFLKEITDLLEASQTLFQS